MTFSMELTLDPFRPPDPDGKTNEYDSVTDLFLSHIDTGTPFPVPLKDEGVPGNNARWQHLRTSVHGECPV